MEKASLKYKLESSENKDKAERQSPLQSRVECVCISPETSLREGTA